MGKTKDIIVNNDDTCTFIFKDDVTSDNGVFDPGANSSGELKIEGMGKASMLLSRHFFPLLREAGIPTHDLSFDLEKGTMTAKKLNIFPVEFIWRAKAWGSFSKTYGVEAGTPLSGLVEATYKSDALCDPRINREALAVLHKLTEKQYDICDGIIRKAGPILAAELSKFGYELIDFKAEFGVDSQGNVTMGDEISGGIWRVLKDGKPADPIDCAKTICPEYY